MNEISRHKVGYFSTALAAVICLIVFDYGDCISYTVWSVDIWEALFNGRIGEYFTVSAENKWGAPHGGNCYGVLWLVPWAVWNLPIWLIQTINGTYVVDEPVFMIWSKLFLILCTVLIGIYSKKIVKEMTNNDNLASLGMILTMAGGTAMISVGYSGQDEVMYMSSFLIGAYSLMVGKKVKGIAFLSFSVICFPLMILPLAVILLVKERNIIKIATVMVAPVFLDKVVSRLCGISAIPELAETYHIAAEFTLQTIINWYFMSTSIWAGKSAISILALILAVVLICCYARKHADDRKTILLSITVCFLSIYMLSWMHAYRYYSCMVPAIIAVLVLCKDDPALQKVALFAMCLLEYTAMTICCYDGSVMAYNTLGNSVMADVLGWDYNGNFITLLNNENEIVVNGLEPLFLSVSVGLCLFLLWILIKVPKVDWKFDLGMRKTEIIYVLSPLVLLAVVFIFPLLFW